MSSTSAAERKVAQFRAEPLRPGDPRLRPRGRLLIIGGHEDKEGERLILSRLVQLAGTGRLVVATLATSEPRASWEEYERVFRNLGAPHVFHLDITERAEAESVAAMRVLESASAVFFTGGDQVKITSLIGDTPVFSRVFEILLEGGTIAGTSAGASAMSETMLIGGQAGESHKIASSLRLGPGFGFAKDMVIDQHFAQRGRINRLLAVVAQNPRILGIGIDENTAIELRPNRDFRVLGDGGVTVLDGRGVTYSNITEANGDDTLSLYGVCLSLLSQGDVFDLVKRQPTPHPAEDVEGAIGVDVVAADAADD